MRLIGKSIQFIIATALLCVVHIAVSSLFSFPYNTLNMLLVVFCLHILLFEKGTVVWLAFATHFLIELYGTLPFGITLFSATMAVLAGFWLFEAVFTNRSWYTATALSVCIFLTYRLIYTFLLFVVQQVTGQDVVWGPLLLNFAWEFALSTVVVSMVSWVVQRFHIAPKRQRSIFMRL